MSQLVAVIDLIIESKVEQVLARMRDGETREAALATEKAASTLGAGSWQRVEAILDEVESVKPAWVNYCDAKPAEARAIAEEFGTLAIVQNYRAGEKFLAESIASRLDMPLASVKLAVEFLTK